MHLSKNEFFFAFAERKLDFYHFEEKDDPHISCILEITDCERRG